MGTGVSEAGEPFVHDHEIQCDLVQVLPPGVDVFDVMPNPLSYDWPLAAHGRNGMNARFAQILVHPARVVREADSGFEGMDVVAALGLVQALVVGTREPIDDAYMAGFRKERVIIDKAPQGDEAVH